MDIFILCGCSEVLTISLSEPIFEENAENAWNNAPWKEGRDGRASTPDRWKETRSKGFLPRVTGRAPVTRGPVGSDHRWKFRATAKAVVVRE